MPMEDIHATDYQTFNGGLFTDLMNVFCNEIGHTLHLPVVENQHVGVGDHQHAKSRRQYAESCFN